jgi:hypothetical protein
MAWVEQIGTHSWRGPDRGELPKPDPQPHPAPLRHLPTRRHHRTRRHGMDQRTRQTFAASTVPGIITVFSMMLDDAVDEGLIHTNPYTADDTEAAATTC